MLRKKKYEIEIEVVELEADNYHIVINSVFGNDENRKWIIDTGASKSVFDTNLDHLFTRKDIGLVDIQSAGIGEMQVETFAGVISKVQFGDLTISNFEVALIDLQHVNNIYQQFTEYKIAGLLGSDVLMKHHAIIDYKKMKLTLYW